MPAYMKKLVPDLRNGNHMANLNSNFLLYLVRIALTAWLPPPSPLCCVISQIPSLSKDYVATTDVS